MIKRKKLWYDQDRYDPKLYPGPGGTKGSRLAPYQSIYEAGKKLARSYEHYGKIKKFLPYYYQDKLESLVRNPTLKNQDVLDLINAISKKLPRSKSRTSSNRQVYQARTKSRPRSYGKRKFQPCMCHCHKQSGKYKRKQLREWVYYQGSLA